MYRLYKSYPVLLIIAAFGPYLSINLGIRVENLLTYPLALLFLPSFLIKSPSLNKYVVFIFILWAGMFIYLLVRTLFDNQSDFSSIIAEVKNFTQPLAILVMFSTTLFLKTTFDVKSGIKKSCEILILLLCLNTLWSFLGMYMDLTPINQYFWRGDASVAANAATNGRFSGIFNQPMEAGVAYSVALFAWVYLVENFVKVNVKQTIKIILLIIGGTLTVSKVFLIGGVPLFLIGMLVNKQSRKQIIKLLLVTCIIGTLPVYYLTQTWSGLDYLLKYSKYTDNPDGLLFVFTAGRYGGNNPQQSDLFGEVWSNNPLYGDGLGSQQVFDSAFFHFFGDGGMIGLVFYILLLLSFFLICAKYMQNKSLKSESKFFSSIVLLMIMGSFGTPILTLNRSSIFIWVFIGLLLQYLYMSKEVKNTNEIAFDVGHKPQELSPHYKI